MRKSWIIAVGFALLAVGWAIHFSSRHFSQNGSITGHILELKAAEGALARSLRPKYPFSIIAGGAYSQAELHSANNNDSVVRAHYADFDLNHARLVKLTDDQYQYASYRVKNQVFWTKRKLRIPSGEVLWTDGKNYARARCGNRLSAESHEAMTSKQEPNTALLSLPNATLETLPSFELAKTTVPSNLPADSRVPINAPMEPNADMATPQVAKNFVNDQPKEVWAPGSMTQPATGAVGGPMTSAPVATKRTVTPTPPVPPPFTKTPPPTTEPVPEPSTIYLSVITLAFAMWSVWFSKTKRKPNA